MNNLERIPKEIRKVEKRIVQTKENMNLTQIRKFPTFGEQMYLYEVYEYELKYLQAELEYLQKSYELYQRYTPKII
jgi:hypothetical protein